jgi:hypothetical protein
VTTAFHRRPFWWTLVGAGTMLAALRRVSLGYGASGEEIDAVLLGDELLSQVGLCARGRSDSVAAGRVSAEVEDVLDPGVDFGM